jgi:5'-nucleotidase/UDP-sugar diphosphatase
MKRILDRILIFTLILMPGTLLAGEKSFTIIHSNDLHSHLLGAAPNIDYTPKRTGDDGTLGGWARIATVIKQIKKVRKNPVLVLDAGDFLMGSLFHLLAREESFELQLMKMMGYDMTTLGNHEFDLKPSGLARILMTAHQKGRIPDIVLSNACFSKEDETDDALEEVFHQGIVKAYRVLELQGVRIGFFGLMGIRAAEVAPFSSPVTFENPVTAAKRVVKYLRDIEKVDMVVCLSHGGLAGDPGKSEDELLAKKVDGIDIIISGHTHTKMDRPLVVNDTIIAQAWEYGKRLGVMDITFHDGRVSLDNYESVDINDTIKGDVQVSQTVRAFETLINEKVLSVEGLSFRDIIAHTDVDLKIREDESNLGNLIADSIRWSCNKHVYNPEDPPTRVSAAFISNGVIRDDILKGKTGDIAVCDAFRAIPLGIGFDEAETMGYPLVTFYLNPSELKKGLEILTSIYPMKGADYFLQVSGIRFTYNPNRMLFDRVTEVWMADEAGGYSPLDYSTSNTRLLRVAADIYNATFLMIVGNFTWHILDIVPKDRDGNPIQDLRSVRVDADKNAAGIQELKEWKAMMEYIRSFPDTNGVGLPEIPAEYKGKLGRNVIEASWNPVKLLSRGTYVTWTAFSAFLIVVLLIAFIAGFIMRKISH